MSAWSSTVKSGDRPSASTVQTQQAVGDGVERPAPDFAGALRSTRRPARESISRAARRENVSSRMRSGGTPLLDQMRDATGEGPGFAGARAGDDQDRAVAAGDRLELRGVERGPPALSGPSPGCVLRSCRFRTEHLFRGQCNRARSRRHPATTRSMLERSNYAHDRVFDRVCSGRRASPGRSSKRFLPGRLARGCQRPPRHSHLECLGRRRARRTRADLRDTRLAPSPDHALQGIRRHVAAPLRDAYARVRVSPRPASAAERSDRLEGYGRHRRRIFGVSGA